MCPTAVEMESSGALTPAASQCGHLQLHPQGYLAEPASAEAPPESTYMLEAQEGPRTLDPL